MAKFEATVCIRVVLGYEDSEYDEKVNAAQEELDQKGVDHPPNADKDGRRSTHAVVKTAAEKRHRVLEKQGISAAKTAEALAKEAANGLGGKVQDVVVEEVRRA